MLDQTSESDMQMMSLQSEKKVSNFSKPSTIT